MGKNDALIWILGIILVISVVFIVGEVVRPTTDPATQRYDVICNIELKNVLFFDPIINNVECNWKKASLFPLGSIGLFDKGNIRMSIGDKTDSANYEIGEFGNIVIPYTTLPSGSESVKLRINRVDRGITSIDFTLFNEDFETIDSESITFDVGG